MMRPKNARGDGTFAEAGRYETHGDRNCGSVVALEMSSIDPGSGVSGEVGLCANKGTDERRQHITRKGRSSMRLHKRKLYPKNGWRKEFTTGGKDAE
jgi:hypothetical protein